MWTAFPFRQVRHRPSALVPPVEEEERPDCVIPVGSWKEVMERLRIPTKSTQYNMEHPDPHHENNSSPWDSWFDVLNYEAPASELTTPAMPPRIGDYIPASAQGEVSTTVLSLSSRGYPNDLQERSKSNPRSTGSDAKRVPKTFWKMLD